jgi:predicted  nucleic acid-binding Zn-ribbon protein
MTRRTLPKKISHEQEIQSLNNRLELQKNLINAMSEEMAKLRVRIDGLEREWYHDN